MRAKLRREKKRERLAIKIYEERERERESKRVDKKKRYKREKEKPEKERVTKLPYMPIRQRAKTYKNRKCYLYNYNILYGSKKGVCRAILTYAYHIHSLNIATTLSYFIYNLQNTVKVTK